MKILTSIECMIRSMATNVTVTRDVQIDEINEYDRTTITDSDLADAWWVDDDVRTFGISADYEEEEEDNLNQYVRRYLKSSGDFRDKYSTN